MYKISVYFFLLIIFVVNACSSVLLTERRQLTLLPESELQNMSVQSYNEVLKSTTVVNGTEESEMIKRVGSRMQKAVEQFLAEKGKSAQIKNYEWEFNLIDEDVANAWAMPGGKIAFYTGILPICESEAGVAVVMGHEIAHVIAKHGNERMSQGMLQQFGSIVLQEMIDEKPEQSQALFQGAYGLVSNLGVSLPFSRLHESEADEMGLIFMAIAGYDPAEAITFWQRMSKEGGQTPPEFLSTHPDPAKRAQRLQELQAKALPYYEKSSMKD